MALPGKSVPVKIPAPDQEPTFVPEPNPDRVSPDEEPLTIPPDWVPEPEKVPA